MKKLFERGAAVLLAAVLVLGGMQGLAGKAATPDGVMVFTTTPAVSPSTIVQGGTASLGAFKLNVQMLNPETTVSNLSIGVVDDANFSISGGTLYKDDGKTTLDTIKGSTTIIVSGLTLHVGESTSAGSYRVKLKLEGSAQTGTDLPTSISLSTTTGFEVNVTAAVKVDIPTYKPSISAVAVSSAGKVDIGDKFSVTVTATNNSNAYAKSVSVAATDAAASGFTQTGSASSVSLGDMSNGSTAQTAILNFTVSKYATAGIKTLTIGWTWKDTDGNDYSSSTTVSIEVNDTGKAATGGPNIVITNASHSPSSPNAGAQMNLTFTVENKGAVAAKEVKVVPTNLSATTFSPNKSNPSVYIGTLKAGVKKTVTMGFQVSKNVVEGLNTIDIAVNYVDAAGAAQSTTTTLFIQDVQNQSSSKTPKLIVSKYDTGSDQVLKAGAEFPFTFSIQNTHDKTAAKNIKVTISSDNNVFQVINGSNTFYIPIIKAGKTEKKTLNMKVKFDSTTQSYPLKISFEYEYDGMPAVEGQVAPAVTVDTTLNLSVEENARPVISNILLGSYDPATVGVENSLTFDFYNMGKATLSNCTAKIESDSLTQTGDMVVIGNVDAGGGGNYEIPVTPSASGDIKGTLILSYEDSNGVTQDVKTEFTATVQEGSTVEWDGNSTNMVDMNGITDGGGMSTGTNWKMIGIIGGSVVAAGIVTLVVVRKVKKGKKKEDYEDD